MWLLYAIFWFIDAAAHYYYSLFLMSLAILPQLIGVPCIIIFIELSRKENVSSVKITALFVIEIALLYVNFLPGGREVIPGYGVHNKGILRIFQIIFLLYFVFLYFMWSYQTWKKAPHELKRLTTLLLFGSILFSIVTALMYALGSFIKIFNSVGFFINGIGAFITVFVILKEPKIIYILPFKAYRILVVDTNEGLTLFKYDWAKLGEVEENIFSTVLQSVGSILDEILKKGEVREIQMDRAVLLIQHDKKYPIASVLITSKSTKSLRYSLKVFYDQFISTFYTLGDDLHEVSKFEDATSLIKTIFDFVPEYRKMV
jgi:ABC-type multidrug transport system fused ATPase/permease subunit